MNATNWLNFEHQPYIDEEARRLGFRVQAGEPWADGRPSYDLVPPVGWRIIPADDRTHAVHGDKTGVTGSEWSFMDGPAGAVLYALAVNGQYSFDVAYPHGRPD